MIYKSLYESIGNGRLLLPADYSCDVFVSAYNLSDRVISTFDKINSGSKYWVIHNEYEFSDSELPYGANILQSDSGNESDFIYEVMDSVVSGLRVDDSLCIDVTGFMRPHLMFLLMYLRASGVANVDLIYTEPSHYLRKSDTVFSSDVYSVRQVGGYEGVHKVDLSNDVLLVGCGYDHDLVSQVISYKSGAKLLQLLSLPSLSADMYQESLVRLQKVADAPMRVPDEQISYVCANDPFATCLVLEKSISKFELAQGAITNLYLSPLATKPQVIGFALYYIREMIDQSTSVIFPYAKSYSKETGAGVGRRWLYRISIV